MKNVTSYLVVFLALSISCFSNSSPMDNDIGVELLSQLYKDQGDLRFRLFDRGYLIGLHERNEVAALGANLSIDEDGGVRLSKNRFLRTIEPGKIEDVLEQFFQLFYRDAKDDFGDNFKPIYDLIVLKSDSLLFFRSSALASGGVPRVELEKGDLLVVVFRVGI